MMKRTMTASEKAQRLLKRTIQNGISTKKLLLLGGVALLAILGITMSGARQSSHRRLPVDESDRAPCNFGAATQPQGKKYGSTTVSEKDATSYADVCADKDLTEQSAKEAAHMNRVVREMRRVREEAEKAEALKKQEADDKAKYQAAMAKDVQAHRRIIYMNKRFPYATLKQECCMKLETMLKEGGLNITKPENLFRILWKITRTSNGKIMISAPEETINEAVQRFSRGCAEYTKTIQTKWSRSYEFAADEIEAEYKDLTQQAPWAAMNLYTSAF